MTIMRDQKKCVVCDKPFIAEDSFTLHCKQCKYVYHICFGSVADGQVFARMAGLDSLLCARRFEESHENRKSLLRTINAEISRLHKYQI